VFLVWSAGKGKGGSGGGGGGGGNLIEGMWEGEREGNPEESIGDMLGA